METDNKFEKLKVWQQAHDLTLNIYKITKKFPKDEHFSLCDQIKRSASSVPANIAEGNERKTTKEFTQFLYNAKGSLAETKYHLLLAKDLSYISIDEYQKLSQQTSDISKMLCALIKYLKKEPTPKI